MPTPNAVSAPRLSIVIPTYNRRARLERVLAALAAQTTSCPFEVVVVDDGSKDDTVAWLGSRTFPFALELRSQTNAGPAVARNTGILAARGDLLLFLDDDVVPEPELIEQHLRVHDAERVDVVVLGPLSSLPHYAQPWVAWEQMQVEKQYTAMQRGDYEPTFRQFWTGNASVLRRHVVEAGLFDVSYLRGEDVELARRLAQRGLVFRFNPLARGLHHAERSLASFCHAHESYGRLEVEIFGQSTTHEVIATLAGNLRRMHGAQRALILGCLRLPPLQERLIAELRRGLESGLVLRSPLVTNRACSLLANLLYWRASAAALGQERFEEVKRRARAS